MINRKDNPVEWALIQYEIDDAIEHLQSLAESLASDGSIEIAEYRINLGHVYSHLNRAWNSRNRIGEQTDEHFELESKFPSDLDPV